MYQCQDGIHEVTSITGPYNLAGRVSYAGSIAHRGPDEYRVRFVVGGVGKKKSVVVKRDFRSLDVARSFFDAAIALAQREGAAR